MWPVGGAVTYLRSALFHLTVFNPVCSVTGLASTLQLDSTLCTSESWPYKVHAVL